MLKPCRHLEQERYTLAWGIPAYSDMSPGEQAASLFGRVASPRAGSTLIDLGCGKGAGGLTVYNMYGLNVTYLDIVRIEGTPGPFIEQPLWEPFAHTKKWDYGYCCDVMEHIPAEFTMLVVRNILDACKKAFFAVSFQPDVFGPKYLKEPLHLTVQDFRWWRDRFKEVGTLLDGRDLLGKGVFYVEG
tara:strand:+ start:135 stop:695 length:561 start_codon:yes stop_codon:yes gene_type:complete